MHTQEEIRHVYKTILDREPDSNGLHGYMNSERSLREIGHILKNSDEYKDRIFFNKLISRLSIDDTSPMTMNLDYDDHKFPFKIFNPKQDTIISLSIFKHGIWEEDITSIWYDHIKPNDLVLDIGANIGWYSKLADLKGANCISIEPEPSNISMFKSNCPNAELHEVCVGNSNEEVTLYKVTNNHGSYSVFKDIVDDSHLWNFDSKSAVVVKQKTLDEIVGKRASLIAAVKMDVEGFEEFVVEGGKNTFSKLSKGTLVIFEIYPRSIHQHGLRIDPMIKFMEMFSDYYAICANSKKVIPKKDIVTHLMNPEHFDWNVDVIATV